MAKNKVFAHWVRSLKVPNLRRPVTPEPHCTALCCALRGQSVEVLEFIGTDEEASRLRDLGVREGVIVTVVRDGDPLMVRIADARFGIGRTAAMNVLCRFTSDFIQ